MAIKYAIVRVNDKDPDDITMLLEADFADTVGDAAYKLAGFGQKRLHRRRARKAALAASSEVEERLKALTVTLP